MSQLKQINMKKFNLDEYLKNPERKVITGDGRNVRIICPDAKSNRTHTVVTLVEESNGSESIVSYTPDGQFFSYVSSEKNDLYFAPSKHEGWINIFTENNFHYTAHACVCKSREEAEKQGKGFVDYEATIKIEWEE